MMFRPARALLALSAAALTIAATPGLAHAAPRPDVVHASVAPGSQTDRNGGYYVVQARPGATITQQIVITNPNDHPVTANVAGVDAGTSNDTGVSYGTPGTPAKSTGAWISIVTPQLRLDTGESRTIPFTITVPSSVTAGQYLGGVGVSVPATPTTPTPAGGGSKASFAISLQTQRVIAVEVVVPGPRAPDLVVHSVKPVVEADSLRLQFGVTNAGNAFAKGQGSVTVADTHTRRDFKIDTFVSHTSIKLAVQWTKAVVPGVHQVTLRLQDQNGRVVTWTGSVDVSGSVGASLERTLAAAKGAKLQHGSGSSLKWWALVLVPICIAGAVHLHRRRSSAAPAPVASSRRRRGATATPPRDKDEHPEGRGGTPERKVGAGASR